MTSDLEKYTPLTLIVKLLWKRATDCESFGIWFETSSALDYFSTVSKCNKKAREELRDLSKLAKLIGHIRLEKLKEKIKKEKT